MNALELQHDDPDAAVLSGPEPFVELTQLAAEQRELARLRARVPQLEATVRRLESELAIARANRVFTSPVQPTHPWPTFPTPITFAQNLVGVFPPGTTVCNADGDLRCGNLS